MIRLLQGDVGSGKTVVALMAMAQAAENGFQSALMAPTEVLARQHFATLEPLARSCRSAPCHPDRPRKRAASANDILRGSCRWFNPCCRRHARAVSGGGCLSSLGLAVVDEQHRFGVHQRLALVIQGRSSRPVGDDRNAHSAHTGADRLWRHGCVKTHRKAGRPPADQDCFDCRLNGWKK